MRELMKTGHTADNDVVSYMDMTREAGLVCDRTFSANMDVMGKMYTLHNEAAVPHRGRLTLANGTVDGDIFPADNPVADDSPSLLSLIAEILRYTADHGVLVDNTARAKFCVVADPGKGSQYCSRADLGLRVDDTIRTNIYVIA